MERLSTLTPLSEEAASAALSRFEKTMVEIPRLWPFGPYVRKTFLTGPIVLLK